MNTRLFFCLGLLSVSTVSGAARESRAQCCEQAYRILCQTVYEERQVTCFRQECETVYEAREIARQVPVWETEQRERRYKVLRPVHETSMETVMRDCSYDVVRNIVETHEREERYTVQRPVWETQMREERYCVQRPVCETVQQPQCRTVMRPVTTCVKIADAGRLKWFASLARWACRDLPGSRRRKSATRSRAWPRFSVAVWSGNRGERRRVGWHSRCGDPIRCSGRFSK
jgi:hypothetical protein